MRRGLLTDRTSPLGDRTAITGPLAGLTFIAGLLGAIRIADRPFPRPGSDAETVRAYYRDCAAAARFSAAGQGASVLMLAMFTRSVAVLARESSASRRLRGGLWLTGLASAATLAAAAATHVRLTGDREHSDSEVLDRSRRVFVLGGPVHGVCYGAFTALATSVSGRAGLIGPVMRRTGYGTAVAGALSPSYFAWEEAGWLIPIGRFGGYVVTGKIGASLARPGRVRFRRAVGA